MLKTPTTGRPLIESALSLAAIEFADGDLVGYVDDYFTHQSLPHAADMTLNSYLLQLHETPPIRLRLVMFA